MNNKKTRTRTKKNKKKKEGKGKWKWKKEYKEKTRIRRSRRKPSSFATIEPSPWNAPPSSLLAAILSGSLHASFSLH